MPGIPEIATAVVATLTPFLPYLINSGETIGEKLLEVIAERGGEAAWQRAQTVWQKIAARFRSEPEFEKTAELVAINPVELQFQKLLGNQLAKRLAEHPELIVELEELLGGPQGIQQVIAGQEAIIEDITQTMSHAGQQTVQGGERAEIRRVSQSMGSPSSHSGT